MFHEEKNSIEAWALTSMYNWVTIKIAKSTISPLDEITGFCTAFSTSEICSGNIMHAVNIKWCEFEK